jgi:hypothetical protein
VAIGAILAIAMSIFAMLIAQLVSTNSHQSSYLTAANLAYQVAESGMREATGRLIISPLDYAAMNGQSIDVPEGRYQNDTVKLNSIVAGGYYIVTTASVPSRGGMVSCRLHTHVRLSNVGDYFAAVADRLDISDGANIAEGRIYAPKLNFVNTTAAITRVKSAQFVLDCTPPINWSPGLKAEIVISEPVFPTDVSDINKANQPVQLLTPIVFPQVTEGDLVRYKNIADGHTWKSTFTAAAIFPPGYQDVGGTCNSLAGDTYPVHTCDNNHHIYYSTGDMFLDGVVHGQVIFVSEGNIYINGNLTSAPSADQLPGAGFPSSSTAHQAILVTRKNVIINNTYYQAGWTTQQTQDVQALILAPHGEFRATPYTDASIHTRLSLRFEGSLILGHLPAFPDPRALASVFLGAAGRTYVYMQSLKDNPPPDMPAILDIYASLEERMDGSMY